MSINFGLQLQNQPGSVTRSAFFLTLGESSSLLYLGIGSENGMGCGGSGKIAACQHSVMGAWPLVTIVAVATACGSKTIFYRADLSVEH